MSKTKGFLFTAGIVLATAFTISCEEKNADKPSATVADTGGTVAAVPKTATPTPAPLETKPSPIVASKGLITGKSADIFQLYEPIPFDNKDYVFKKDTLYVPDDVFEYYGVYQGGEYILIIEPNGDNTVSSLTVLSSRLATDKGIRMGSTFEELRKAYPKAEYTGYNPEGRDEFWIEFEPASGGEIRAAFSEEGLSKKGMNPEEVKITDFKKGAKIQELKIGRF